MVENIFHAISLVVILLTFSWLAPPLGGLIYALFAVSIKIPYIGSFLNILLNRKVKLIVFPKLFGWLISSSSLLLSYLIYSLIFGGVSKVFEFQLLALFSIIHIINITQHLISFNLDTYSEYVIPASKMYKQFFDDDDLDYHLADFNNHMALSRSLFLDLYLPQLFRLVFAFAIIYYSLGNLGYIELTLEQNSVSLWESIKAAFTIIPLVDSDTLVYKGSVWNTLDGIAKFLMFLWSIFFIASAQSMFSDEEKIKNSFPSQEEIMKKRIDTIVQDMKDEIIHKGQKQIDNEASKNISEVQIMLEKNEEEENKSNADEKSNE